MTSGSYCPFGWTESRFVDLTCRDSRETISRVPKSSYKKIGRLPVVDQGQEPIAGYVDDYELLFRGVLPVIVFGDHTRKFKYVDFPFVVGADGTRLITPAVDRVDCRFFYYALANIRLKNLGYSRHFKQLKEQVVQFPESLSEQRKIAAILFSVDDAIEKTQAAIDQARIVKRGLMQELFTRGLPNGTGSSEWNEERLGNLFTLQLGKMLNKKARETRPRFPYLGNRDVQWGRIRFSNLREMHFDEKDREKYRLLPGDLLVCEGGEVGRTAILDRQVDCYYQKAIHRLRVLDNAKVEPRFILHYMRFAAANGMLTDLTAQSSIAHLTREKLSLLKVYLPPLPEQRAISDSLSAMDDFMAKSEAVIRQAQVAKQGLMSVLLTGEVRVTPDTEAA